MIEIKLWKDKKYHLLFVELGDPDDLNYYFKTFAEAVKEQKRLVAGCKSYYTEISKMLEMRRKEEHEKEQVQKFGDVA